MIQLPVEAARLPVFDVLEPLLRALSRSRHAVLQAPTGAGKTTVVPLVLLDAEWLAGRRILLLEPRRLAARAAAARMASLLGEEVGQTVGYRIRLDSRVGPETRIEVLTEGILTRRLQRDPALDGVGLVIFDEAHERHLQSDLALALTLDARAGLREDLRILVTSATLDAEPFAALLGGAPVITSAGRSHPVEVEHSKRDPDGRIHEIVAAAVRRLLPRVDGDVLVFLPGTGEIRRTTEELLADPGVAAGTVLVRPLHGSLAREDQDAAIRPDPQRRQKVVLSTSIAETSLTIEGTRAVVDSGWARLPRFDPRTGLTGLVTVRVSKASADQRAGRAGRLGPGLCVRLWSESTHHGLQSHTPPEIRSADLAPLALELARWGTTDVHQLRWLEAPPDAALAQARALLQDLGALDERGRVTDVGQAMARLPAHPRLARMMVEGRRMGCVALAADLAALVGERDPFTSQPGQREQTGRSVDVVERLDALAALRAAGPRAARGHGADPRALRRIDKVAARYRRTLGGGSGSAHPPEGREVGLLLAFAYPDRVAARREGEGQRFLLASGRGVRLPGVQAMAHEPFLVAAHVNGGRGRDGVVHLAAGVHPDDLREGMPSRFQDHEVVTWRDEGVVARREERFGALVVASAPLQADEDAVRAAVVDAVRAHGLAMLPWDDAARQLQARVRFARRHVPDAGFPDVADEVLQGSLDDWLGGWLTGVRNSRQLARVDLVGALEALLPWATRQALDELAPTHLQVPSGARHRLAYPAGDADSADGPVLAVKLQEMFGLAETPSVARGRVPVTLHLLSPARRPIQVTRDLRSFWERTYPEVRKELKGRYPKHPWPDDPWSADATARTKRRPRKK